MELFAKTKNMHVYANLKKNARQNSITESLERRLKAVRQLKCDLKYQISNKYSATVSFLMQKTVTNYNYSQTDILNHILKSSTSLCETKRELVTLRSRPYFTTKNPHIIYFSPNQTNS